MSKEPPAASHGQDAGAARPLDPGTVSDDITHFLGHSWFFDPQTIKVSIRRGQVTLDGSVRSDRERRMAAAAAWEEEGVTEVVNNLAID
jgi:osmotically-inducible protein OsmY